MALQRLANLDRRLRSVAGLTDGPALVLGDLPFKERQLKSGETLHPPGSKGSPCYILITGAAIRFELRSDGIHSWKYGQG